MSSYRLVEKGKPLETASKALILLHGRGGSAEDILEIAPYFSDDSFYIAALEAPGNSWYPKKFFDKEILNEPFLSNSIDAIHNLIEQIKEYIPQNKIYLMGFSQGACLSLEVSSRRAGRYGGIIAFTGALIGDLTKTEKYQGNFEGTQVFIGNCEKDPFIPLPSSIQSKQIMDGLGANVLLKVYEGRDHTIRQDEIDLVKSLFFS